MKRKTAVILPILLLSMLVAGCFGKKNTKSSEEPGSSQTTSQPGPGTSTTSQNPSEDPSEGSSENPTSEDVSEGDQSQQSSEGDPTSEESESSQGDSEYPEFHEIYRLAYGEDDQSATWGWDSALEGVEVDSEDANVAAQLKFELTVANPAGFKIRTQGSELEEAMWLGANYAEGAYHSDAEEDPNIQLEAGEYHIYFKEYMVYELNRFSIYIEKQGGGEEAEFADLWKLAYGVDGESPTWAWDEALVGEELASEDTNVKNQLKFRLETALPLEFKIRTQGSELEEAVWLGANYAESTYHSDAEGDPNIAITAGNYDIYFKQYIDYDEHEYSIAIVKEIVDVEYTVTDLPDWWDDSNDTYAWAWGGAEDDAKYDVELSGSTATLTLPSDREGFLLVWVTLGQEWSGADWTTNLEGQSRDFVIDGSTTTFPYEVEVAHATYTITGVTQYLSGYDFYYYFWGSEEDSDFISATLNEGTLTAELPVDIDGFLVLAAVHDVAPDWPSDGHGSHQTYDVSLTDGVFTYACPAWK